MSRGVKQRIDWLQMTSWYVKARAQILYAWNKTALALDILELPLLTQSRWRSEPKPEQPVLQ